MVLRYLLVERPLGTLVALSCLALLGLLSLWGANIRFLPDVRSPFITVTTVLFEADAEEIETLITKKVEDALADTPGLKKMESVSREGESTVSVQLHSESYLARGIEEVRGRVRRLLPELPHDTKFPVISLYSPSDTPLALLAVTGGASLAETAQWVHEKLKPGLSRIKGIAAVHIIGSPPTEIVVDCDDARLKALGITVPGVSNLIARGHKSTSAGFLTANDRRMAVRVAGDFKSCSQIGGQPVAVTDRGGITAVGDVARVSKFSHQPHETSRLNGRNLISVALYRSGDSEPRTLWAAVREELSRIRLEDSASHSIDAIYSQGQELAAAFSRLGWILVIAVAVAAVALLFFLGSITPTLIVALSIPFSLLVTRLFMYVFNVPLDLVSMSGLIIGVGLLVDNSIVVAEAISVQCLREGSRGEKILAGVQEVAAPLVVSTFTTILAFLPLVFVSPQIRRFYAGLTSSVSLSLAVSLIAALVLVPLLLRLIPGALTQRASTFPHGLGKLPSAYGRTLHVIRSRPGLICAAAGVLLLVSVAQIPRLAFGDRGSSYERDIQVALVMPPGTARNVTQDQIHLVEQVLMKIEGLDAVYSRTWANQGLITVKFKERHSFEQTAGDFIESVRERLKETTRAQTHVWPTGAKERDATLSVILSGPSLEKLSAGARMVRSALLEIAGVRDVMALHGDTVPALEFRLRHEKIGFYHVGARDVAEYVRSHVTGPVAARVFEGEREVKVRVRSLRQDHETSDSVRRSFLKLKDGGMVPLPELISPHRTLAPTEMHRENRSRVARLEVLLAKDTDLLGTATRIKAELDRFTLPEGYGVKLGDQMDRIVRTRSEMLLAAIVAVVFVYLLLVSATESFLKPIMVLSSVPFAAAGALLAALLVGLPITRPVYMGLIMLCGLVINVNLLIAYTAQEARRHGQEPQDAMVSACLRRLRPVLMTTVTTLLATSPMFLDHGKGSGVWRPFALTVAAGLTCAAFCSLVFTPALYLFADQLKQKAIKLLETSVPQLFRR